MIRTLITIAFASFILAVACLAGAAALGGRDIAENGWTIPSQWQYRITERQGRNRVERVRPSETITRELTWNGGESLVLDLPVDVTYVQGAEARVVIEGPKDYAERITLEGGRFGLAGDVQIDSSDVTIDLNGVRVLDASDRIRITVTAPKVSTFTVNGAGDLDIRNYDQPRLTVQVQGSGDVTGAGRSDALKLGIVGSGSIDLADIDARDAEVSTSGSGDTTVSARGVVKVAVAGSGDVSLRAKPASLTSEISGSGNVDQDY
jgi:hypothetical protein